MRAVLRSVLGADTSPLQRLRLLLSVAAIILMVGITVLLQVQFTNRPLQVRELAGKQVSIEKMSDVFISMDLRALQRHFLTTWTWNGVVFLGAWLLLSAVRDTKK
jgi:hypothetical protein